MTYGPETETVEAFIRHLKRMTPEQWVAARDAAWDAAAAWAAARDAAWDAARDAAWDAARAAARAAASDAARAAAAAWAAAWDAAWDAARAATWAAAWAANEIQGAAFMRDRGKPFYFLPMFGFTDPEAVLAADKEHEQ